MLAFLVVAIVLSLTFFTNIPSVKALNISTSAIRANEVWATGNRGEGVNVAVIDRGFDINHNDLAPAIVHRINAYDWSNNVGGDEEHRTHVAGIVAGRGINNNIYRGVAWEAGLVLVKAIYSDNLEPAVHWVIDNRGTNNIRVIQSSVGPADSWGDPIYGGDGLEHPYSVAMDDAVVNGIVVVQAAGNSGPNQGTIESPGSAFNVITVGAIDDKNNTIDISDDTLADFSSRGPTGDGRPKPDVVAPWVNIMSLESGTQGYRQYSGTSMAAPHVAGTVALILHANPNLTPAQVKAILRQTARLNDNLKGLTVNDRGHGIIDAFAAVQLAQNVSNIQISQMYDSWDVSTPNRYFDPILKCGDSLTFTVSPPSSSFGISVTGVDYHWWDWWGLVKTDYRLLWRMSAWHVWIGGTYYNLGSDMNRYLLSGPHIYEKGAGYVRMLALYKIGNAYIIYHWYMHVDEVYLRLQYFGGGTPGKL